MKPSLSSKKNTEYILRQAEQMCILLQNHEIKNKLLSKNQISFSTIPYPPKFSKMGKKSNLVHNNYTKMIDDCNEALVFLNMKNDAEYMCLDKVGITNQESGRFHVYTAWREKEIR